MTCANRARARLILSWLSCFLLIDFAGTRPMTRFEGPAGSGKTTASKLISALLYGEPAAEEEPPTRPTTPTARRTRSSSLDNIEVKPDDRGADHLHADQHHRHRQGKAQERHRHRDRHRAHQVPASHHRHRAVAAASSQKSSVPLLHRCNFDLDEQASDCFSESEATVLAAIQASIAISSCLAHHDPAHQLRVGTCSARARTETGHAAAPRAPWAITDKRRCNDYLRPDVPDVAGRGTSPA